jgi:hypothetical protein
MAVCLDSLDRLDREQADRPMWSAVDGVVVVGVAVETETTDPCQLDGSLWDAAARQVHLDDSAVHGAESRPVGRAPDR